MQTQQTVRLNNLSAFSFGTKDPQSDPFDSIEHRLAKLQQEYPTMGVRTTVEACILVHDKVKSVTLAYSNLIRDIRTF